MIDNSVSVHALHGDDNVTDLPVGSSLCAIRSPRLSASQLPELVNQNSSGDVELLLPTDSIKSPKNASHPPPACSPTHQHNEPIKRAQTRVTERKRWEQDKRLEQEQLRSKKVEEEKVKKEHELHLKQRRRAEVYALNAILRQLQQEKMAAFISAQKSHGSQRSIQSIGV